MKKYKLIKQYLGCPYKLNQEIDTDFIWVNSKKVYLKDYPENWEEVVEKDYEVLTYKNFITGEINFIGQRFLSNEGYREFTKSDLDKTNSTTNKKVYSINSVKRLSDGEV